MNADSHVGLSLRGHGGEENEVYAKLEDEQMQFVPREIPARHDAVPYFEASQSLQVPGRGTDKSVKKLMEEVMNCLGELGASFIRFHEGEYKDEHLTRYGYRFEFTMYGNDARLDCVALPLQNYTDRKKDRALAQALYLLRDELQAVFYSSMHKPGVPPMIAYLIGNDGLTVAEALVASGTIPMLGDGK
jgi:hypothetical protein